MTGFAVSFLRSARRAPARPFSWMLDVILTIREAFEDTDRAPRRQPRLIEL
jgi:hypothetical protein